MKHVRQAIRELIVDALKAARLGGVNDNVYGSVFANIDGKNSVVVYARKERSEASRSQLDRQLEVAVDVVIKATERAEDDLDALLAEVEAGMPKPGGAIKAITLDGVDFSRGKDAEQEVMGASLTFVVAYSTALNDATKYTH